MRVFDIARFFDGSIVRVKLASGDQVRCILEIAGRDGYGRRRVLGIRDDDDAPVHWAPEDIVQIERVA